MRVDDVSTGTFSAPPAKDKSSKEEFLLLLVAQLQNQNPLEPQSGAEFIAQLAQFASVEQAEASNQMLGEIYAEQVSATGASMASFVGKSGNFSTDVMRIDDVDKGVPTVDFKIASGGGKGTAVVLDDQGNEVRRIDLGKLSPGTHSVQWDGKNAHGVNVGEGSYKVELRMEAADGTESTVPGTISGEIDAIDFSNGFPMMRIGGALFAPGDVLSIG